MHTASARSGSGSRAKLRATVEAFAWLTLGAVLWWLSVDFQEPSSAYRLGAASWPRAILVLAFFFATMQWLGAMRRSPIAQQPVLESSTVEVSVVLIAIFALPLIYAWLLPRSGFFATTPLFSALYFWLLGERNWWRLTVATVALWAFLLLVFSALLYVPLPTGNWPGFYDFSNLVLALIR